ncbi:T0153360 isoform 1 [Pongo abelii]|uniref:T0153360 isoform 1 n=1 Tax=Pongo abelii TaxID=9601 RepID=A0A2J8SG49_PONAB|nr:T0153360 isoform 1 [Pongo abelii]
MAVARTQPLLVVTTHLGIRQEERLHEQEETPREQEKLPGQETLLEQNNENKSTLQLEQQVKELKKLGAPGSYQPGETAAKAQLSLVALPGEGDLESQEAMVAFFNSAGASALEEQRVCCQRLAHPVASSQKKPEAAAPAPETGGKYISQGAVPELQHWERRTSSGWPRTRRR